MTLAKHSGRHAAQPATKNEAAFSEVVSLIVASREKALRDVNTALIDLYWRIGEIISRKIETAGWGDGWVDRLAQYIVRPSPAVAA